MINTICALYKIYYSFIHFSTCDNIEDKLFSPQEFASMIHLTNTGMKLDDGASVHAQQ
jgi:hypothetical protein